MLGIFKFSKFFKIFGEVCFLNSLNSLKFGAGLVGFGLDLWVRDEIKGVAFGAQSAERRARWVGGIWRGLKIVVGFIMACSLAVSVA